ncbi:MAG: hypothetical protein CL947_03445 [Epsilonproteobacteria bacterium]|nr:hypothetical protein [Campylobacterota bacterium]|tara:strand:- start:4521 stop:5006 length:486 start_codon:yes stop_codon:yes gene_type:complete
MTINGSAKLQNSAFIKLIVNGSADVQEITVTKQFIINGSLEAIDSNFENVIANGTSAFTKCKVVNKAHVSGTAYFQNSDVDKVEVISNAIEFENCKVVSVVMKKVSIFLRLLGLFRFSQKIVLNDTVVAGDIVFESGNGTVVLQRASRVVGKIIGGKIIQK